LVSVNHRHQTYASNAHEEHVPPAARVKEKLVVQVQQKFGCDEEHVPPRAALGKALGALNSVPEQLRGRVSDAVRSDGTHWHSTCLTSDTACCPKTPRWALAARCCCSTLVSADWRSVSCLERNMKNTFETMARKW
jgi:hypothetical protein